jgi:hypothetical protein
MAHMAVDRRRLLGGDGGLFGFWEVSRRCFLGLSSLGGRLSESFQLGIRLLHHVDVFFIRLLLERQAKCIPRRLGPGDLQS